MKMIIRAAVFGVLLLAALPSRADDYKPDDRVTFVLSAEDWVSTASARVVVGINAALAGSGSGSMRAAMQKAVNGMADAEWRLTNFSRSQDKTGLERWYASFEARIPENKLGGIHDTAKALSKAGMQLTVAEIAFDPTLAEVEATKARLRAVIYKQIIEQQTALNGAITGRQYRVGSVDFGDVGVSSPPFVRPMMLKSAMAGAASAEDMESASVMAPMQVAQKIVLQASVTFAALPSTGAK